MLKSIDDIKTRLGKEDTNFNNTTKELEMCLQGKKPTQNQPQDYSDEENFSVPDDKQHEENKKKGERRQSKFRYNNNAMAFDIEDRRKDPSIQNRPLTQQQIQQTRQQKATQAEIQQRTEILHDRKSNQQINNDIMSNLQFIQQDINTHLLLDQKKLEKAD